MSATFPLAPSASSPLSSTFRVGSVSSLALFFSSFFFFFQLYATSTLSSLAFSITFCAHGFGKDATGERFD